MRLIALSLALAACGPTNPNQANYDRVRAEVRAEFGLDDHGHGHGHDKAAPHGAAGESGKQATATPADSPATTPPADAVAADDGAPKRDLENGKKVYNTFCVACHGADGQGMNGLAANFVADPSRLQQEDSLLVKRVREGYSGSIGVMPPWGAVVNEPSAYDAIAYIRSEWGE